MKIGDDKRVELFEVYVCVDCKHKVRIGEKKKEARPRKCSKCGGVMAKMIVLGKEW